MDPKMFGLVPGRVELLFSEMGKALEVLGRMGCPVQAVGGSSSSPSLPSPLPPSPSPPPLPLLPLLSPTSPLHPPLLPLPPLLRALGEGLTCPVQEGSPLVGQLGEL